MVNEKRTFTTKKEFLKQFGKKSHGREMVRSFMKNKPAVVGMIIFCLIVLMAIFAPLIANYNDVVIKMDIPNRLQGPSVAHILGTDEFGRDIFARLAHGAQRSLSIGISAIFISLVLGGTLGAISGFFGGKIDNVIMRCMDVFLCLPDILLALTIVAAFGMGKVNLMIAIGLAFTPKLSRIMRTAVMGVRSSEYVEAARSIGAKNSHIISSHIIINCVGPIIVQVTLYVANAILTISALSFIGLGIASPEPEWGNMLATGRDFMRDHPHVVLAPGMAIFFTILSLNLLGDGLRDTLDPRLK